MSQNQSQIDYWNGEAGDKWVTHAQKLDAMLEPFSDLILEHADIQFDDRVLDIGCGAGALSLRAAEKADVLGVDVSTALLKLARERSGDLNATFQRGDAASYDFGANIDAAISRFGVMFFDDPIAAFSHIRSSVPKAGKLCFTCWQTPDKNAWAMTPLRIALPFLKTQPEKPEPRAPGPFAFADPDYVREILEHAGWSDISINSFEIEMVMPGDQPNDSAEFMLKMGPMARLIAEQNIDVEPVIKALTNHFQGIQKNDGRIALDSAVWLVKAT